MCLLTGKFTFLVAALSVGAAVVPLVDPVDVGATDVEVPLAPSSEPGCVKSTAAWSCAAPVNASDAAKKSKRDTLFIFAITMLFEFNNF